MSYADVRLIHITCVGLSLAGFIVRGVLMLRGSPWLHHRLVRTLPHINDTILLSAAIGLSIMSGQYPWNRGWLAAKITALLVYIALGMVAFRFGSTLRVRVCAWLGAIVVLVWMISVARLRDPLGALVWLANV